MQMTRRSFSGTALAFLAGCGGTGAPPTGGGTRYVTVPNAQYDAYMAEFRSRAAARGISADVMARGFRDAGFIPEVIERDRNQSEFKRPLVDYLALVAPEDKVPVGRLALARERATLDRIAARYGVEAEVLASVWGVESYFGTRRGDIPVLSATSTLAFEGRRRRLFEAQMLDALRILQDGDARPDQMRGSWAGAMGHTQLMPTSFRQFAVDFDGDGWRDVWGEDPTDALASTARYFRRSGWQSGRLWGMEVTVPEGVSGGSRSPEAWRALGLRAANGARVPDDGTARLARPAGPQGPAFLLFRNFDVIKRYNPSDSYAFGVGYLSDRLRGAGPWRRAFPPDENGLSLADRKALQQGLNRRGFDAGTVDGVLGDRTEAAIRAYQAAQGMPVTGTPSQALLAGLR